MKYKNAITIVHMMAGMCSMYQLCVIWNTGIGRTLKYSTLLQVRTQSLEHRGRVIEMECVSHCYSHQLPALQRSKCTNELLQLSSLYGMGPEHLQNVDQHLCGVGSPLTHHTSHLTPSHLHIFTSHTRTHTHIHAHTHTHTPPQHSPTHPHTSHTLTPHILTLHLLTEHHHPLLL